MVPKSNQDYPDYRHIMANKITVGPALTVLCIERPPLY